MKRHWKSYIGLLALAFGLVACSTETEEVVGSSENCAVQFRVSTQNVLPNDTIQPDQLMRLFVGERKPEHGVEELHLLKVLEDVEGGHLTLDQLKPQWYKFVFVCVPRSGNNKPLELFTEIDPGEATCDMNRILLDYEPILKLGPGSVTPNIAIQDGNIYRKVVSLWLEKGKKPKEDVVLNRVNGQLIVDMGILCDQFKNYVDSVVLELTNHPTRMFLTDNDKDEIRTTEFKSVRFRTEPKDQSGVPLDKDRTPHKLIVNLLPCELDGKLKVYTKFKVDEDQTGTEVFEYPLKSATGQTYYVKQNTKTTLKFNGIYKGDFDVKYAGFDGTQIDVEEDKWNGWPESTTKPETEKDPQPDPEPAP